MVCHKYENVFEKNISPTPFLSKWLSGMHPVIGRNVSVKNGSVDVGFTFWTAWSEPVCSVPRPLA